MFENKEGQSVPAVTFHTYTNNDWLDVNSSELFDGKTVIVFSLPGAYTPTCSSAHVPRFNQLYSTLTENGVDDIICISVNDTFVMNAWAKDQNADNIRFIPDGNGEFTEAMGLLVDKNDLGFGKRSWRYSMLVKNGIIDKMFIEPNKPGDPFEVSDADTMLEYIAPNAKRPLNATIFTRAGCPFCAKAKEKLKAEGVVFEELALGKDYTDLTLRAISASSMVPQIFIDGDLVGGSSDLEEWFDSKATTP
ncbi:MAG TPA: glutathione peroxidase [Gammaproteobacteria bacterium]|nr:glutathione peroxidase [Gammaproteobacteria bacterium]